MQSCHHKGWQKWLDSSCAEFAPQVGISKLKFVLAASLPAVAIASFREAAEGARCKANSSVLAAFTHAA